jgi:transcriptional regulator with XRE-family HTH domain
MARVTRARTAACSATLRRARSESQLSLRELARRLGVSHENVALVERGADPCYSTAVAYLRALPGLTAADLFAEVDVRFRVAAPNRVWQLHRDLFGFEAAAVSKTVEINARGDAHTVIETSELRTLSGAPRELRLLMGLHRAVFHDGRLELRAIRARRRDGVRTRAHRRGTDEERHEMIVSGDVAAEGVSYRRTFRTRGLYHPTRTALPASVAGRERAVEGMSFAVEYPIRRLALAARFPAAARPVRARVFVWPAVAVPNADLPDAAGVLYGRRPTVRRSLAPLTLAVLLDLPLVGFKYGLGWEVG